MTACGGNSGDGGASTAPAGGFTVSLSDTVVVETAGGSRSVSATIARTGSFVGSVALSAEGLPTGVSATISPSVVTSSTSTATIAVSSLSTTSPGTYSFTLRATSAGQADRITSARVTVTAVPAFVLGLSTAASVVQASTTARVGVQLTRTNFGEPVQLSVEGTITGITATFGNAALTGDTTSLNVAVASSMAPGVYPLTVRARSSLADRTVLWTVTVTAPPDFSLSLAPASVSVSSAPPTTSLVRVVRSGGFAGAVALTAEGLPTGVTITAAQPLLNADTTTLTITVAANVVPGVTPVIIRGRAAGLTDRTIVLTITVTPPPDFSMALTPATVSARPTSSTTSLLRLVRSGGFVGAVALSAEGVPAGVTLTAAQPSLSGDTTTLTLTVGASAVPGAFPVIIRGRATGIADRIATLSLTVTSAGGVTLTLTPAVVATTQGGTAATTVTITRVGPYTAPVSLTIDGVPSAVTGTFASATLAAGVTSTTLTLTANTNAAAGTYPIVVRATALPGSGIPDQTAIVSVTVTAASTSLIAQHALAQQGMAIALASTVLQSQLQVLGVLTADGAPNATPCTTLVGGGSVQSLPVGQNAPRKVGIYYDFTCQRPFVVADIATFVNNAAQQRYDLAGTVAYYGPTGTALGVLALQETAVIGGASDPYVAGLGTFTPTNGATPVRLGLTCTVPSSFSSLPCSGGVMQNVPSLARAIGSVTPLVLQVSDLNAPVSFTGSSGSLTVGSLSSLILSAPTATTLAITGGAAFGTSTQQGSAATFSLFPPTPTGWSVTDVSHDMKFELNVVSNTVRNSVATIKTISTGQLLATLSLDQSGTGTVTWSDGSTYAVTSWMFAN